MELSIILELPDICRTAISEIGMKLFSVIKDFDICKKILLGLFTGLIDFGMHAFYFKRVEKTFDLKYSPQLDNDG